MNMENGGSLYHPPPSIGDKLLSSIGSCNIRRVENIDNMHHDVDMRHINSHMEVFMYIAHFTIGNSLIKENKVKLEI
jgi:hypothetical protein